VSEAPQKLYCKGKDVETMSREELIEALRDQAAWLQEQIKNEEARARQIKEALR
jgi:hypothetical protein